MIKCHSPSCTSAKPALWEPQVLLWAVGQSQYEHQPAVISVNVVFCSDCCKRITVRDLMEPDVVKKIKQAFFSMRKAQPNFRDAKIMFINPDTLINVTKPMERVDRI